MNRQMTLAEMNDEFGAARTKKKEFLNKTDSVIPWETFVKEIDIKTPRLIQFNFSSAVFVA